MPWPSGAQGTVLTFGLVWSKGHCDDHLKNFLHSSDVLLASCLQHHCLAAQRHQKVSGVLLDAADEPGTISGFCRA